jgi:hypothetical protein
MSAFVSGVSVACDVIVLSVSDEKLPADKQKCDTSLEEIVRPTPSPQSDSEETGSDTEETDSGSQESCSDSQKKYNDNMEMESGNDSSYGRYRVSLVSEKIARVRAMIGGLASTAGTKESRLC